jgi:hypothetical protein
MIYDDSFLVYVLNNEGVEHAKAISRAFNQFKNYLVSSLPLNQLETVSIEERLNHVRDHTIGKLGKFRIDFNEEKIYEEPPHFGRTLKQWNDDMRNHLAGIGGET